MQKLGVLPRAHWIATEFGGNRIELVLKRLGSNIVFSNEIQDPWSRVCCRIYQPVLLPLSPIKELTMLIFELKQKTIQIG
ncbi:lysosomal Pro-X carboxypeptidase-like [Melia azedarach]|uniref:Lysosomal Pro-X carboxypeptidase-like n=1 Tax=Melia azedarach TaxID=155640 RepID=A0ACC1XG10_MELAZ|nr:lysosomal Pro-X carboxypeptidase-like [Melia azedarach]